MKKLKLKKSYISKIVFSRKMILLFLCLVISSCKKDNTSIVGNVWDISTNGPFSGGQVTLRDSESSGVFYGGGCGGEGSVMETAVTDENGNFRFDFRAKSGLKVYCYWVQFEHGTDFYVNRCCGNKELTYKVDIAKKEAQTIQLSIAPAGKIKFIFSPSPPYPGNDSVHVNFKHKIYNFSFTDKGIFYDIYSDMIAGEWSVNITKQKSGVTSNVLDTFYLNQNDKITYIINY